MSNEYIISSIIGTIVLTYTFYVYLNKKDISINNQNKNLEDYQNGDIIHGMKISQIVGKSGNTLVFLYLLDKRHQIIDITTNTADVTNYTSKASYASHMASLIDSENLNLKEDLRLKGEVASIYYSSLLDKVNNDLFTMYANIEANINQTIEDAKESKHIIFISCNIFHSFLFIGMMYFLLLNYHASSIAVIGGVLGAMLSVIQRNKETKQVHFKNRTNIVLFSFISIILGATSGFILYWASNAGIILSDIKSNTSALFIFAIAAGFSERYFNSFLKKAETSFAD